MLLNRKFTYSYGESNPLANMQTCFKLSERTRNVFKIWRIDISFEEMRPNVIEEILSLAHKHDIRGKTTNPTIGDAPRLNLDIDIVLKKTSKRRFC